MRTDGRIFVCCWFWSLLVCRPPRPNLKHRGVTADFYIIRCVEAPECQRALMSLGNKFVHSSVRYFQSRHMGGFSALPAKGLRKAVTWKKSQQKTSLLGIWIAVPRELKSVSYHSRRNKPKMFTMLRHFTANAHAKTSESFRRLAQEKVQKHPGGSKTARVFLCFLWNLWRGVCFAMVFTVFWLVWFLSDVFFSMCFRGRVFVEIVKNQCFGMLNLEFL